MPVGHLGSRPFGRRFPGNRSRPVSRPGDGPLRGFQVSPIRPNNLVWAQTAPALTALGNAIKGHEPFLPERPNAAAQRPGQREKQFSVAGASARPPNCPLAPRHRPGPRYALPRAAATHAASPAHGSCAPLFPPRHRQTRRKRIRWAPRNGAVRQRAKADASENKRRRHRGAPPRHRRKKARIARWPPR